MEYSWSLEALRDIHKLKTTFPHMLDISISWVSVTSSCTRMWKENLR